MSAWARILAVDECITVVTAIHGELLADAVNRFQPDVVLVDIARPDRDTLEGLRLLGQSQPRAVVLFVDQDDAEFMAGAIAAGVVSYNVDAVDAAKVKPILRSAMALFGSHQATRHALSAAQSQLAQRQLIDQAKRHLMASFRLSEPQAHRRLQQEAMEQGKKPHEMAELVLKIQITKDNSNKGTK